MTEQAVKVPDIGGAEGAEIVEVFVKVGDNISLDQSLLLLESDKAAMEIPATIAGVVKKLSIAVGDLVSEGDLILTMESESVSDLAQHEILNRKPTEPPVNRSLDNLSSTKLTMEVLVPDLGSDQGADLVEILVSVGESVQQGDSLVLLESDKASMEVPSPASGIIAEWLVEVGTLVKAGTVIATLSIKEDKKSDATYVQSHEFGGEISSTNLPLATKDETQSAELSEMRKPMLQDDSLLTQQLSGEPPLNQISNAFYAGPAVRKLARELGVALVEVNATGARGRILKKDVQNYVAQLVADQKKGLGVKLQKPVEIDYSIFGPIEHLSLGRIDKTTASNMENSWSTIPHVTQFQDADISELENFRESLKIEASERGIRLTPLAFIIKACEVALREHPRLKCSITNDGQGLIMKSYCHIGFAVDTDAGLFVPVIRDVDKKSIWQVALDISVLAKRTRDRKLRPEDMQGGVFTVSSLGQLGGRGFSPIINPPEVAILGVGCAAVAPVWDSQEFRPRKLLPLSLSYDHRVVNGVAGGRFLTEISGFLSDVRRMLM